MTAAFQKGGITSMNLKVKFYQAFLLFRSFISFHSVISLHHIFLTSNRNIHKFLFLYPASLLVKWDTNWTGNSSETPFTFCSHNFLCLLNLLILYLKYIRDTSARYRGLGGRANF